jgi:cell division protein FtsA
MGALVIDLGGGTTEFVVCANGIVKHTGLLAVGGDHVSNDLAYGLKLPLGRAERLKLDYGAAEPDETVRGQTVSLDTEHGFTGRSINLEHLRRIMSVRLEEVFELIAFEVSQLGLLNYLGAGVFLCGGGARVPGIQALAQRVFGLPVSLGKANSINGLRSALDQPEFATAIGLVRFGSFQARKRSPRDSFASALRSRFGQLLRVGRA